jgi:hypothetical protein
MGPAAARALLVLSTPRRAGRRRSIPGYPATGALHFH